MSISSHTNDGVTSSNKRIRLSDSLAAPDSGKGRLRSSRSVYPRKRAVAACQTCRERKKKCDNSRPSCGFCLRLGSFCSYVTKDASTFDSASLAILDRLSTIESLLRTGEQSSPSTTRAQVDTENEASPAQSHFQPIERSSPDPFARGIDLPSLSRIRTDTVLFWPAVQKALSRVKKYFFLDQNGNRHYTYLCNSVAGESESSTALRGWKGPSHFSTDRTDIEVLVNKFFRGVHTKNPILDRSVVRQYCEEIYEQGPLWNTSTCLVLILCALGAVACSWEYQPTSMDINSEASKVRFGDLSLANRYFAAAEKRLGYALIEPGTLSVQCLCLAGMFQMYTLNPLPALRLFHTAGTVLQSVLSTSEDDSSVFPLLKNSSDITSRLYWTCFKSEREILAEVPVGSLAITHLELSEQYPSPPQSSSNQSVEDEWRHTEEDSWYYFLSEIALRRIADRIVGVMFSEADPSDFANSAYPIHHLISTTIEFERQLSLWRESLPSRMAFSVIPLPLDNELKYFLRSRYYLISELLYRPFLCYAIHSTTEVSVEVMELAHKGLQYALNYLVQSNHTHRHHGKWLQLRREVTAVSLLLAASKSSVEMPVGWYAGVRRAQESLKYWSMESPFLESYLDTVKAIESYFVKELVDDVSLNTDMG